ncbi:hypothetical protein JCM33374_g1018 [Metschnikowia sp. JCM 33374]|nr:hypothetical protein JCM33374_g1018 [Metschnikowia sp. JCM 33374]
MKANHLYMAALFAASIAALSMDVQRPLAGITNTIVSCAVALFSLNPTGCIAPAISTILQAFTGIFQQGGAGQVGTTKVKRDELKVTGMDGQEMASMGELPPGVRGKVEINGVEMMVQKYQSGMIGWGVAIPTSGDALNRRDEALEIWGIGSAGMDGQVSPTQEEYQQMAMKVAQSFERGGGVACSTVKDGEKKVFKIKWVVQPGGGNPGAETCD